MTAPASPASQLATPAGVVAWLQGAATEDEVAMVVAAVNDLVDWLEPPAEGGSWRPRYVLGATMLAGRLWRRRNSPAGVESFAGDAAVYVQRNDPDVAMLLELGAYTRPGVG
jgi:hypothetical protein